MIKFLEKTSSSFRKKANIFAKFFGENILKIKASVGFKLVSFADATSDKTLGSVCLLRHYLVRRK
jgi:hypothetical protein